MRDRARAGDDAGFSAAGARPPRPRRSKELRERDTWSLFRQAWVHEVEDTIRHLAFGHAGQLLAGSVREQHHPRIELAAERDVLARDVVGDDGLQSLLLHLFERLRF